MLESRNTRGLGLIEIMIFLFVISVIFSVSLNQLSDSYGQRAFLRQNFITKKSFGGAEIIMIDQQQCKCNFADRIVVPRNIARNTQITVQHLKSYEDTVNCSDGSNDLVLSDTSNTAVRENRARQIMLSNWSVVIPELVYRARVFISPVFGRPVSFPVLFSGRVEDGNFDIEICGVDRAT